MKQIILYSYDCGHLVSVEIPELPALEVLTKEIGKWDQNNCWRLNNNEAIFGILKVFQDSIFKELYVTKEPASEDVLKAFIGAYKVFTAAFLNNETVYMDYTNS